MPDRSSIATRVKSTLVQSLNLQIDSDKIPDSDILLGAGLGINSISMMELLIGLEREFGIEFEDEQVRIELFESVDSIVRLVAGCLHHSDREEEPCAIQAPIENS
jgi:acyl carrier protein